MAEPHKAPVTLTRRETLAAAGAVAIATLAESGPAAATIERPVGERATALYPHESATRDTRDLSGLWWFRLDPKDEGEAARWFDGLKTRRRIPVPCSWNDLFDDAADYFGAAWYQTEFHIDRTWRERSVHLRFGSAVYSAKVWLNGRLLGQHVGGHLPFAFEIGDAARFDGPNRLVIMIENRLLPDRVPATPDPATARMVQEDYPQTSYDFFPYCGLHRPVWLFATPRDHVHDITVTTELAGTTGRVEIAFTVNGGWSGPARIELSDGISEPIATSVVVRGGAARGVLHVPTAKPWSPDDPFLYTVTVRLGGATPTDEYALKIGIRTIAVDGDQLLLNGKPVHLRGFGKHEDFIVHGRGLDLPVLVRDFELLKWIGANSFRTSHYPYSEEAMMLADEYGFLVIAETPGVSLAFSDTPAIIEARRRQLHDDITDLIDRDKNHPCVILWSLANEPLLKPFRTAGDPAPDAAERGRRFFAGMFDHARALDPTRPVALVSLHNGPAEWASLGDVICTNSYNGWYSLPGRIDEAAATLEREMQALHARHGAKPIIVTEFGADAIAGVHSEPPEMWSEDYQADLIAAYIRVLDSLPFVAGAHPWAFADFRTAQSTMRVGGLNLKGVFTRDRRPKLAAHILRDRWASKRSPDQI